MSCKIVFLSDTHCQLSKVQLPKGDLLIHSGDLTYSGTIQEIQTELDIIAKLDFEEKIIIAGNHDWLFQKQPGLARQMCKDRGIIYLEDSSFEFDGLKIYGSPWQPFFCNWAFNLFRGDELKKKWDLIPDDTKILVTHSPVYGILDSTILGERVGCEELYKRVMEVQPLIHSSGHIHDDYGTKSYNDTLFINASTCNESYRPVNKPIVVEIEEGKIKGFICE